MLNVSTAFYICGNSQELEWISGHHSSCKQFLNLYVFRFCR